MGSTVTLAFRNIFRHKRRTLLLGLSIWLGAMVLMLGLAFVDGIQKQLLGHLLVSQFGNYVVHNQARTVDSSPLAKPDTSTNGMLADDQAAEQSLLGVQGVSQVVKRITFSGSVLASGGVVSTQVVGLEGVRSQPLSELVGAGLPTGVGRDDDAVFLTKSLSDDIGASVGDHITLMTRTGAGETVKLDLTVAGMADPTTPWQTSVAYVTLNQARRGLGTAGKSMEWLVYTGKNADTAQVKDALTKAVARVDGAQVTAAQEAGGFLVEAVLGFKAFLVVELAFIFIVVALAMSNMMLTAILERTREVGTLLAMGTSRRRVAVQLVLEAVLLALMAVGLAFVMAYGLVAWLGSVGIDLREEAMRYMVGGTRVYPAFSMTNVLVTAGTVVATIFLASLSPAVKASRWSPIQALRGQVK